MPYIIICALTLNDLYLLAHLSKSYLRYLKNGLYIIIHEFRLSNFNCILIIFVIFTAAKKKLTDTSATVRMIIS